MCGISFSMDILMIILPECYMPTSLMASFPLTMDTTLIPLTFWSILTVKLDACTSLTLSYAYLCISPAAYTHCCPQAVASRGEFGVLGPGDDCWTQMACQIPSADDDVHTFSFTWMTFYLSIHRLIVTYSSSSWNIYYSLTGKEIYPWIFSKKIL